MKRWLRLVPLALALLATPSCHDEPLEVAPDLDIQRFQGNWYEIAKLPRATQSDCAATTASYMRLSDSELVMVNSCHLGSVDGPLRTVSARARIEDPSAPAKLAVDFGGFFGAYWVIEVGAHYEYAVVGHPTRDYLWIVSRTPTLPAGVLSGILERAHAKKFDVNRLQFTVQK